MRGALAQSTAGRSGLFLISGEPGIGKTYLAERLSAEAAGLGALAVWGRALEGGGTPPFWPWIQVVRAIARECRPEDLASRMNGGAAWISQIVPELRTLLKDIDDRPALESEHARFYLFDAIARFLRNSAAARPLLVVLDDVHWVDEASLLLLQFITQELKDAPILSIALYRQTEVDRSDERSSLLAGLARDAQHLTPRGFDGEEISSFVEKATGTRAGKAVVKAVHDATGGNPFFVTQLVRLFEAEGALDGRAASKLPIPENVRLVVRRRLAALPASCRSLLSIGAVVGREMDTAILQRVSGKPAEAIAEGVELAAARGLIRRSAGGARRYSFVHALVRETLYDDLPSLDRRRLHLAIGIVLEERAAGDPESRLDEVAHHYFESLPEGEPGRALVACVRAGDHALGALAYEEAARHFEHAAAAHQLAGSAQDSRLCEILIGQGRALTKAGRASEARTTLIRATDVARKLKLSEAFARAIVEIPVSGSGATFGSADQEQIDLLEEALAGLERHHDAVRVRVLALLATELTFAQSLDRRLALTEEALSIARRGEDAQNLAAALTARIYALGDVTGRGGERKKVVDELIELGRMTETKELAVIGYVWRCAEMLILGDLSGADAAIRAHAHLAETLRQPRYLWMKESLAVMRALLDGRFADAEVHIEKALAIGESCGEPTAAMGFGILSYFLRRDQGRSIELEAFITTLPEAFPNLEPLRPLRAQFYADVGRLDEARWELEHAAVDDFAGRPNDIGWLPSMIFLSEPVIVLRDQRRARALYDLLLRHASVANVIGPATCWHGPVAHSLGRLAALLEDFDAAERHFDTARKMSLRMGARPWLTRTQVGHASMLLDRGGAGDVDAALDLIEQASSTAAALGMAGVTAETERLSARAAQRNSTPAPAAVTDTCLFRNEGEYWAIGRDGETFRLKDTKGLHYISLLLAHPGREFHVLDLVLSVGGTIDDAGATVPLASGDVGEVLDQRARDTYRARMIELREGIEESQARNDTARAEQLGAEIEALTEHLSSALGLGGRSRRLGSPAERARVNITRSVKAAIRRIAESDRRIGEHLERGISTGNFCSYEPRSGEMLTWNLG